MGLATPEALETALVGLLNTRLRAFGELWYWFDLEPLFEWADHPDNAGPAAEGLSKLLRTITPLVNRLGQLLKAAEVRMLLDLLAASPGVREHASSAVPCCTFPKLGQWLVPPTGAAALAWPSLPWSFVIVYNALPRRRRPAAGLRTDPDTLSDGLPASLDDGTSRSCRWPSASC